MPDREPFGEIERVFGLLSEGFGVDLARVPVDVVDRGDAFVVRADLPGYERDAIDVSLTDDRTLEISAARDERTEPEERYVSRERRQRTARRTVRLPDAVEADDASARYEAGVLEVRLAKRTADDENGQDIPVS